MKKLAYISSSQFPSTKANSVQVMKMCEEFGKHYNVTLYGVDHLQGDMTVNNLYTYYGCENNFKINLITSRSNVNYSLIIFFKLIFSSSNIYYSRNFLVSCLLSLVGKKNVIFEVHIDPKHQPIYNKIFKYFLRFFNIKIVAISGKLKEIFAQYYNFSLNNIFVAHDAADVKLFKMPINEISKCTRVQVGYIGSLYKGRGLEIVCKLAKLNLSIDFNIVGGSENEINDLKTKYKLSNLFFHGHVPYSEVPFYINKQNILLAPYQLETQIGIGSTINTMEYMSPLKIFEYMASKRPIIISNLKIIYEVLDNKSACIVSPENINEWNCALSNLVNDENYYSGIVQNAYLKFINNFTIEKRVLNISNFIINE